MKKLVSAVIVLLFFTLGAAAQKYGLQNLVGRWESSDGAGIEVLDSARIYLLYNGEKKRVLSFECNFSKSPCWFDFKVGDSAEKISMKSLILFINDDLLQWQIFEDERPANFSAEKGTMVYMKRRK